jgi:hypothetical protein
MTSVVQQIVDFFRGGRCHMKIRREGNEFSISALTVNIGPVNISLGGFSNKIKALNKATRTALTLDNGQYLFCDEIEHMDKDEDPQYRLIVKKIRIVMMAGLTQLSAIIDAIIESKQPDKQLNNQLVERIKYMESLMKRSLDLLFPEQRKKAGPGIRAMMKNAPRRRKPQDVARALDIKDILNYLKIDERDLDQAAKSS